MKWVCDKGMLFADRRSGATTLEELHQRMFIMEGKVEQLLEHSEGTDETIVEIKTRMEDQRSLLHVLLRQDRSSTRQRWSLWVATVVLMFLLFLIVLKL